MIKSLKKYIIEREKLLDNTAIQKQIELEIKNYKYAMMRKSELEKMRANSLFMKDWWSHGLEEHSKNLNIRKETELRDLRIHMDIAEKKRQL